MHIRFLYFEGCPNSQPALDVLTVVLGEEGITEPIEELEVTNAEQATRERFLGSPSIQIDGLDIEVSRRNDSSCFACRVYQGETGRSGVPPAEMIRTAIRLAKPEGAQERRI